MRLFLVDSSIFVFRAWYGPEPERANLRQQPNQAFVGFSDFVYRLLTEQAPSRIVFAFDESLSKSARKEIYPDYKANRSPAPQQLKRQFAWCRQWLEALGISCVSSKNWEADDLIGSLANYHRSPRRPLAILTADKDLAQLIEERDLWWSYLDDKKLDYRAICKKFGVEPRQIAAQLALTGDKVDNIPGIPEIGPKTAARLLKKFDTLENLRRNLRQVGSMKFRYAARVQRSLLENEALLDVSFDLTRINREIAEMRQVETARGAIDAGSLERMMREQAFDGLRRSRWLDYIATLQPGEV
ncbi:MAG: 5'-3' exonuclease [Gammaproteobacteria bacterium]|nr:5'-3' exonuclease [Gammaproteobacteria bacterium]MDH3534975.1 5'-3' exonuclease [Gammaproteobacteria bacterium]